MIKTLTQSLIVSIKTTLTCIFQYKKNVDNLQNFLAKTFYLWQSIYTNLYKFY